MPDTPAHIASRVEIPHPLYLSFHGRVLQHLGIQMYQSPVNAIAELVANAWDANAETVDIILPELMGDDAVVVVDDDGHGMTFHECQYFYLSVGRNRRGANPDERTRAPKLRPVLGRKGIGKFAGFGIAEVVTIDTVAAETGERTVFQLDLRVLMSEEYVGTNAKEITVLAYEAPDEARKQNHGTTVTLEQLTIQRRPSPDRFAESMARRFLLRQDQEDFLVRVNENPLPDSIDLRGVEYVFPRDFHEEERPEGLIVTDDGWGVETLEGKGELRWRFMLFEEPIEDDELRGVAIYAKEKLAQQPFLFNITQGITGQQGVEYLAGQVRADYLDVLGQDLIATERQRVNWEHEATRPLLAWGEERVKLVLRTWVQRRGEERVRQLREKMVPFSPRLERLSRGEARTVNRALAQLAKIPRLSQEQFEELGGGLLTAWEQGRLRDLMFEVADAEKLNAEELLAILVEAKVVTALNTAEAVKTKLAAVWGLKERVERRELENAVRDFIAENPWLISPEWETYRVERGLDGLLREIAEEVRLTDPVYHGRVDLALASGTHLIVIEFMRPGLPLDWDHLNRYELYVLTIRRRLEANTGGPFKTVSGYVVADRLERHAAFDEKLQNLKDNEMYALDWGTLLGNAIHAWRDFLFVLGNRDPDDVRLKALIEDRKLDLAPPG